MPGESERPDIIPANLWQQWFPQKPAPAPAPTAAPAAQDPLAALYNAYGVAGAATDAITAPQSDLLNRLSAAESSFIPEMLSSNYRSTPAGSAAYESAAAPINSKYDDEQQTAEERLAAQGITPTSGLWQQQMQDIEAERNQALSGVEQQFNALLPERQQQGIGQLTSLLGLEQQRELTGLGIEQNLDEAMRQRILDAMGAGGQGGSNASTALYGAGNLANEAANLSGIYGQEAGNAAYGYGAALGSLGKYFDKSNQPQSNAAVYGAQYGANPYGYQTPGGVQAVFG